MKRFFTFLALAFISTLSNAQVAPIMVCNASGNTCSPYSNIDSAIVAANPGDYIYVPGGVFVINTTIDKEIHMIGAGHVLDSSLVTNTTTINGNIYLANGASNSSLEGLYITGAVTGSTSPNLTNLHFNYINASYLSMRMDTSYIHGSILRAGGYADNYFYEGSEIHISNSYLNNLSNINSSYVENCISLYYTNAVNLTLFKNNIFYIYPNSPYAQSGSNNSLLNNLYVLSCPYYCISVINSSNNQQVAATDLFSNGFDPANMHLIPGSIGLTAGTDSSQVGVYGGLFPYKDGAIPSNPHIFQKNISASTDANGMLPVQIKVRAENY